MRKPLSILGLTLLAMAPATQNLPSAAPEPGPELSLPLQDALMFLRTDGQGRLVDPKIFGGEKVSPGDDPWQVGLTPAAADQVLVFCGGALIAPNWVVTAAHCVDKNTPPSAIDIFMGSIDQDLGGRRVSVRRIRIHPDYAPSPAHRNDIALIELAKPAIPADIVQTMSAADEADALGKNASARVTGWGLVAPDARGGVRWLRYAPLSIKTNESCNDRTLYDGRVKPEMICAGSTDVPGDACKGDSGGPLTVRRAGTPVLAALVSWGEKCGQDGVPGVYTRIAPFASWITGCQADSASCSISGARQTAFRSKTGGAEP